jgi:hypothetical protein
MPMLRYVTSAVVSCHHLRMETVVSLRGIRRLDFTFAPRATMPAQPYHGSAWRGAFGHALKRMVCAMRLRPCEGCALSAVCIYPQFFGADPAGEASRPYILCPDRAPPDGLLRAGLPFRLRMTLLPAAAPVAPYAVRALLAAAANGLTARRIALDCLDIRDVATGLPIDPSAPLPELMPAHCPPAPSAVRLHLRTPLRLRLRGDLLTGRSLTPGHMVAAHNDGSSAADPTFRGSKRRVSEGRPFGLPVQQESRLGENGSSESRRSVVALLTRSTGWAGNPRQICRPGPSQFDRRARLAGPLAEGVRPESHRRRRLPGECDAPTR